MTRILGRPGLAVSGLGLGCMGMSWAYGPADCAEALATIRRALDLGIIVDPETGRPAGVDGSPGNVRIASDGSLARLGVDHVDLYYQRTAPTRMCPWRRPSAPLRNSVQNCGAGSFLSNDPAPFEGACATRVRRRTGDLPGLGRSGLRHNQALGAGSGSHQTNVDGDSRSGNDGAPARHSTR